jgi:hypothetical protein
MAMVLNKLRMELRAERFGTSEKTLRKAATIKFARDRPAARAVFYT